MSSTNVDYTNVYFDNCVSYKSDIKEGYNYYNASYQPLQYDTYDDLDLQNYYQFFMGTNVTMFFNNSLEEIDDQLNLCGNMTFGSQTQLGWFR